MKDFYKNKRVFLTGVTGFKGAWLAQILRLWGARVVGLSLRPHTRPNLFSILKLNKNIKNYFIDIRDFKKLKTVFAREKPEIVIHLAAQALVRKSYDEPLETYNTNILGTANILECIKLSKSVKSAVIVTTDKVYAPKGDKFYSENDELSVSDPYGSSKAAADIVAQSYIKSFLLKDNKFAAIARAGNVIGGGDWGADRLMTDLVRAVYEKRVACLVRNPHSIRPWQHVFEPLSGYLVLARELYKKNSKAVGVWNFGPEESAHKSVKNVLDLSIAFLASGSYKIVADTAKPETAILRLSPAKAKRELGWRSRLALEEALRLTADWYKAFYGKKTDMTEFSNKQIEEYFL